MSAFIIIFLWKLTVCEVGADCLHSLRITNISAPKRFKYKNIFDLNKSIRNILKNGWSHRQS